MCSPEEKKISHLLCLENVEGWKTNEAGRYHKPERLGRLLWYLNMGPKPIRPNLWGLGRRSIYHRLLTILSRLPFPALLQKLGLRRPGGRVLLFRFFLQSVCCCSFLLFIFICIDGKGSSRSLATICRADTVMASNPLNCSGR